MFNFQIYTEAIQSKSQKAGDHIVYGKMAGQVTDSQNVQPEVSSKENLMLPDPKIVTNSPKTIPALTGIFDAALPEIFQQDLVASDKADASEV